MFLLSKVKHSIRIFVSFSLSLSLSHTDCIKYHVLSRTGPTKHILRKIAINNQVLNFKSLQFPSQIIVNISIASINKYIDWLRI